MVVWQNGRVPSRAERERACDTRNVIKPGQIVSFPHAVGSRVVYGRVYI